MKYLSYCTNIHPGETVKEIKLFLEEYTSRLFSGEKPAGLRLSATALSELLTDNNLLNFIEFLKEQNITIPFINGFPYGNFHREKIKERVYYPDWTDEKRLIYTNQLIRCIAAMPGPDVRSISTVPCSYKTNSQSMNHALLTQSAENLIQSICFAKKVYHDTGISVSIDLEPEIDCLLENSSDVIKFFDEYLRPLIRKHSITAQELNQFCGVCFDSCHYSVIFADPLQSVTSLLTNGIPVHRMQMSSALKLTIHHHNDFQILNDFNDPFYLHQTSIKPEADTINESAGVHIYRFKDLPDAISSAIYGEWRIHYHIPIFLKKEIFQRDCFDSTCEELVMHTRLLLNECNFFEVETYTYDVMPGFMKNDLFNTLQRELSFAKGILNINNIL